MSVSIREKIEAVKSDAERWSAEEILRWGLTEFHPHAAIASSFGAEDVALIDIAASVRPDLRVFTLDTDFLFAETYELIEQIEKKYGITVERVKSHLTPEKQAEQFGPKLWTIDPNKCCELRKVKPLKAKLGDLAAWARSDSSSSSSGARRTG